MKSATRRSELRNFHVPLPESLYERLRAEAERSRIPATELAREAIRESLKARQKESLRAAIKAYATEAARTPEDLDEELEATAVDHLLGRRRR